MFAFLTPSAREPADPLQTPKTAAAWLRQLPALDIIGRQQHVIKALDDMRESQRAVDANRVSAIAFVDAALGADRRQLNKQYIESAEHSSELASRIWQASFDMSQAFAMSYQTAVDAALAQRDPGRWRPLLPLMLARLVHYHGTDAKLRVFKYERWIPAKWIDLHQAYLRSCELKCDRETAVLPAAGPNAQAWSVEQEYLYVLTHPSVEHRQPESGRARLGEFAASRLEPQAVAGADPQDSGRLAGRPRGTGWDCIRRNGHDRGSMLRYVDITPLAESLVRAMNALRDAEMTDQGPIAAVNQQRLAILRKIQPALAPPANTDLRRDPRVAVDVSARVRIGLTASARTSRARTAVHRRGHCIRRPSTSRSSPWPQPCAPRAGSRVPEDDTLGGASQSSWTDPVWEVKDRSIAGLRLAAAGGLGQSLTLGALVAVRQSDSEGWLLGVIRRLNKVSNDEVEAGVNVIAERIVSVTLAAKRKSGEDSGYVVDGVETSSSGARFEGLYLPPPSRPDKPLSMKTLIIPSAEYAEGRNILLTTAHSVYTVSLRHLVEQRSDWTWATIQVVEKKSRAV